MREQLRIKRMVTQCLAWTMVLGGVAVLGIVGSGISFAQTGPAPAAVAEMPLGSLKSAPLQKPDLSGYIQDEKAAVALGKALFWDQQMGSDGQTACASCHYQAGADIRSKDTVSPGTLGGSTAWFGKGPNYQLTPGDYPFHKLADPNNPDSAVVSDTNVVTGSQGVFDRSFKAAGAPGMLTKGVDVCDRLADPTFTIGGVNTRRVTGRNAPSVIDAAYNFRNFWDGRASNIFNGVSPFGDSDTAAQVFVTSRGSNEAIPTRISIPFSSLASQAVGPALSAFEMSCDARAFPNAGRKMLTAVPLGQQTIDPNDSVLGAYANPSGVKKGLKTTYSDMIQKAFKPEYWKASAPITMGPGAPIKLSALSSDLIKLVTPGKVDRATIDSQRKRDASIPTDNFSQMEANFSLFWGLSIQLYEQTLIANDSPVDQYFDGKQGALTDAQKRGMDVFMGQGRCMNCHGGAETTNASIRKVSNQRLERMVMGDGGVAVYDDGFYNIGVRPSSEDVGVGYHDPFGNPLSETARCQRQLSSCDPAVRNVGAEPIGNIAAAPLTADERIAVNGSFKVPGLRNVELNGPYFHNGGQATLREVVDFYDRGGDFAHENKADLDTDISRIGLTEYQKKDLVAFLVGLTDERVRWEKAPFDHPSLCIANGHPGSTSSVSNDPAHPGQATETQMCLPAVGAAGRSTAQGPLKPYLGLDPQSGGVPVPAGTSGSGTSGGTGTGGRTAADPVPPVLPTGPAAATGTLLVDGVTAPGGAIQMGTHTWISDHLLGFCRLDTAADGKLMLNASTCNTAAVGPGQPAFDPSTNSVYVPDLSSKSVGVWRLAFDPATETVSQPTLLPGLAGTRPSTVVLGPDGKLYVGSRSGSLQRFDKPASASPQLETFGHALDATHGPAGIAFVGTDLYLAEATAVTRLVNAPSCTGACVPEATSMQVAVPTAMAADKAGVVYVADTPVAHGQSVVRRYRPSSGSQDVLANAGNLNGSPVSFTSTEGLSVDANGNVLIADDPTAGVSQGQGRLWKVSPPAF
jgi:cytochrome c peroxidase